MPAQTHAVLRLAGFGLRFVPFPPYRLTRLAPGPGTPPGTLQLTRLREGEVRQFEILPGKPGADVGEIHRLDSAPEGWVAYRLGNEGPELRLRAGTTPRLEEDGELTAGPQAADWSLETSAFRCAWPDGLMIASTEPGAPSPFEFHGAQGSVLFLQGPFEKKSLPTLEEMAAPSQRVLGRVSTGGAESIDLRYDLEGKDWRQRHVLLPLTPTHVFVLTVQALEPQMQAMAAKAERLVSTFEVVRTLTAQA